MEIIRTDYLVELKMYVFFLKTFFEDSSLSSAGYSKTLGPDVPW